MLPLADISLGHPPLAIEVIVDVVEPLAVGRTALPSGLNRFLAEAAPEARLKVVAHAAVAELLVEDRRFADAVLLFEVGLERLPAVAHLATLLIRVVRGLLVAPPDLELEVLAVFVPLPVVLAAKLLAALGKCARIGLFVPLLVFPSSDC